MFFFRFLRREGKSFVCFVKPCEAALVEEEEEEEKRRERWRESRGHGKEQQKKKRQQKQHKFREIGRRDW